jgi:hypothetical protein
VASLAEVFEEFVAGIGRRPAEKLVLDGRRFEIASFASLLSGSGRSLGMPAGVGVVVDPAVELVVVPPDGVLEGSLGVATFAQGSSPPLIAWSSSRSISTASAAVLPFVECSHSRHPVGW